MKDQTKTSLENVARIKWDMINALENLACDLMKEASPIDVYLVCKERIAVETQLSKLTRRLTSSLDVR